MKLKDDKVYKVLDKLIDYSHRSYILLMHLHPYPDHVEAYRKEIKFFEDLKQELKED